MFVPCTPCFVYMGNNLNTRDVPHCRQQMADTPNYHSLRYQWMLVDQTRGELRYDDNSSNRPVAQFIGPKPLSESCDSFSIKIIHTGRKCCIGIGVCHKRFPKGRQPGWNHNSIGYHADNGGIYHETGHSRRVFGKVGKGEVMECMIDFTERTVTFLRNGTQVFTSQPLEIPRDGFYPIIGLHSDGEVVRLLEVEPWTPDNDILSQSKDVVFHSLHCRQARVSHRTGIVRYHSDSFTRDTPVGQFVSNYPLSPEQNSFSVEIASLGQRSCISIGVCHRCYPSNCHPGWLPNSAAYHAKDGGIYNGSDKPCSKGPKCRAGDIVSCEIDFSTQTLVFQLNGFTIFQCAPVTIPPGGFHAVVGFHSAGEAVCLLERDPWRPATGEPQENRTTPKCCICMDKGVARFLIPCGHTFCTECIEEWTDNHRTCPACRVPYRDLKMLFF